MKYYGFNIIKDRLVFFSEEPDPVPKDVVMIPPPREFLPSFNDLFQEFLWDYDIDFPASGIQPDRFLQVKGLRRKYDKYMWGRYKDSAREWAKNPLNQQS